MRGAFNVSGHRDVSVSFQLPLDWFFNFQLDLRNSLLLPCIFLESAQDWVQGCFVVAKLVEREPGLSELVLCPRRQKFGFSAADILHGLFSFLDELVSLLSLLANVNQ